MNGYPEGIADFTPALLQQSEIQMDPEDSIPDVAHANYVTDPLQVSSLSDQILASC